MLRFVDLTPWLYAAADDPENPPACAFFDTVIDKFVADTFGAQAFSEESDMECIADEKLRARCRALVPDGFWEGKK